MPPENEIVFEDLHGVNEDEPITVDLDASLKDDGISRAPADEAADDDYDNDDRFRIDELRSADKDDIQVGDIIADPKDDDDVPASKIGADDEYSKKVKARIQRAIRGEKKAKEEASHWETEAKRLAKESYDREKSDHERIIEQADTLIADTQAQLEAAIEDGKTKDQVRLTALLTDQKAAKVQAEYRLDYLAPDGNVQPFSAKVDPTPDTTPTKAAKWIADHDDWYGARGFERQTRLANRLDKEVFTDGFDPGSDEYFEELNARIKEKEPSLFDSQDSLADDDKKPTVRRQTRSPVAGVDSVDARRQRSSSSKVELTERDFAVMRQFNLDPKDPEVLKEFARNKREADTSNGVR
jgi:hypothetical protein